MSALTILQGDALARLRELPDESAHCCVSSPPYWSLRDYSCDGQLGLEKTPEEYVAKMVKVLREVRRVLRKDGTLWLNMGDCYASGHSDCSYLPPDSPKRPVARKQGARGGMKPRNHDGTEPSKGHTGVGTWHRATGFNGQPPGLKPKDLCGIPWRLAFALQADGWWFRQDIIWAKPNPMPESVTDRCTKSHEYLFLLTKSASYFYDAEAIKEPMEGEPHAPGNLASGRIGNNGKTDNCVHQSDRVWGATGTRNKRSVWTVATAPYPEAHFATYPPDLIKPCILAGTSAKGCCAKCGAPWERVVEKTDQPDITAKGSRFDIGKTGGRDGGDRTQPGERFTTKTTGWQPTCDCWLLNVLPSPNDHQCIKPCTVLDPFAGSGTTGQVALELGRKAILIELNPKYVELIKRRCDVTSGLVLA